MPNVKYMKVTVLLQKYIKRVEADEITFIPKGNKKSIIDLCTKLKNEMRNAEKPSADFKWHEAHKKGVELWHELVSYALRNVRSSSCFREVLNE